jgi:two-component system, LytTR family, response regulator
MEKINALIVDDEKGLRELLRFLLEKYCKNVNIVGEANDIEAAQTEIAAKSPDLVFLDVQMPKGDGFSLLNKFSERNFDVIFTTSYAEYAIGAFKVNAVDYLLKPYDIDELKKAVQKVSDKKSLLHSAKIKEDIHISVHKNDRVENVNARDIISLEAQDNYTLIISRQGQKHLVSKVLGEVEEVVAPLNTFIRIHRSVVINSSFIKTYSKTSPYTITMINDTSYEISRRRRAEILDVLKNK